MPSVAKPRLVFASSVAAFGGELPEILDDGTPLTPQTSYGTQKAMGELLVTDFHRKGFLDGRSLRLPTIVVRPGKPNKAASTWASSIFREPLAGQPAVCPVERDAAMYCLSPRRVVDALVHGMELSSEALGMVRSLTLPGRTFTVAEMVESLERVASPAVTARIRWEPDAVIQRIVAGWPQHFRTPAPTSSALPPMPASTRSFASTSTTNWAATSNAKLDLDLSTVEQNS